MWNTQSRIFSAENPEEELSFAKSCLRAHGNNIQIAEKNTRDINDFKKELTEIVKGNRDDILSAWKKIIEEPAAQLSFNHNEKVASTMVQYLHRWWSTASEDNKKAIALRLLGLPTNTTDLTTINKQLTKITTFIKTTAFGEILEEIFGEIKTYVQQTIGILEQWRTLRSLLINKDTEKLKTFDYITLANQLSAMRNSSKNPQSFAQLLFEVDENDPSLTQKYRKIILYLHPDKLLNAGQKDKEGADLLFKLVDDAYKLLNEKSQ